MHRCNIVCLPYDGHLQTTETKGYIRRRVIVAELHHHLRDDGRLQWVDFSTNVRGPRKRSHWPSYGRRPNHPERRHAQ